jgi:hypothetical protein
MQRSIVSGKLAYQTRCMDVLQALRLMVRWWYLHPLVMDF